MPARIGTGDGWLAPRLSGVADPPRTERRTQRYDRCGGRWPPPGPTTPRSRAGRASPRRGTGATSPKWAASDAHRTVGPERARTSRRQVLARTLDATGGWPARGPRAAAGAAGCRLG